MKWKIFFIFLCITILSGSFFITNRILADVVTATIGTPKCELYNDNSGTKCYSLDCKFESGNKPVNYDECQTTDGQSYEPPRANYGVNLCEIAPCRRPADVLKCQTKPPEDSNVISYSYETCGNDPEVRITMKELVCPIKCKNVLLRQMVTGNVRKDIIKVEIVAYQQT